MDIKSLEFKRMIRKAFILSGVTLVLGMGVLASPFRLGLDVQRILGYDSCLPSTLYLIDYRKPIHPPRVGDYPVFLFPDTRMGVGPREGQRAIKLVAAVEGDEVKVEGTELYLRGLHKDRLWLAKSIPGKTVGDFDGHYRVPEQTFFAYGTEKESFDSRYYGPVSVQRIIGYARPLF